MQHLINCYKLWFELKDHIHRSAKYTLVEKIENIFIEVLELIFAAQYAKPEQTLPILQRASAKFDSLKFFLQILWELKKIEEKHYALLSERLTLIGKMLGGWLKQSLAQQKTKPAEQKR